MTLLRGQAAVGPVTPMPIDSMDDTSTVTSVSGETVVWYYVTAGAYAAASGQTAGTIVTAKLKYTGVLNSMNSAVGSYNDTSVSFAVATRASTLVSVPDDIIAGMAYMSPADQIKTVTPYLGAASSGSYAIDHRRGQIWLNSKATVANDSASYAVMAVVTGGSGPTANVNVNQVGTTAVVSGTTTPSAITNGEQNVLADAVYNSSAPSPANGQRVNLQANSAGALNVDETLAAQAEDNTNGVFAEAMKPLATSTYSWTAFQNLGANATLNVKSTTGNVKSLFCHNLGGTQAYIQLHNTATTPGGGATPAWTFPVAANGWTLIGDDFWGENGQNFATGIAFAFSTTETTYTAGTAANQVTQILYK